MQNEQVHCRVGLLHCKVVSFLTLLFCISLACVADAQITMNREPVGLLQHA